MLVYPVYRSKLNTEKNTRRVKRNNTDLVFTYLNNGQS